MYAIVNVKHQKVTSSRNGWNFFFARGLLEPILGPMHAT